MNILYKAQEESLEVMRSGIRYIYRKEEVKGGEVCTGSHTGKSRERERGRVKVYRERGGGGPSPGSYIYT